MKRVVFALFITLLARTALAQTLEDVVYLKNGGIIRGVIIEQIPNKTVKIQTRDMNVFVFKMEEVEKITKEQSYNPRLQYRKRELGNYFSIQGLLGPGLGYYKLNTLNYNNNIIGANVALGFRVAERFSGSLMLGINKFNNFSTAPFGFEFRYELTNKKVSPTLNLGIGYSKYTATRGGFFLFNPSAGLNIQVDGKTSLLIDLGYMSRKVDFRLPNGGIFYTAYENFLTIKFGAAFTIPD